MCHRGTAHPQVLSPLSALRVLCAAIYHQHPSLIISYCNPYGQFISYRAHLSRLTRQWRRVNLQSIESFPPPPPTLSQTHYLFETSELIVLNNRKEEEEKDIETDTFGATPSSHGSRQTKQQLSALINTRGTSPPLPPPEDTTDGSIPSSVTNTTLNVGKSMYTHAPGYSTLW